MLAKVARGRGVSRQLDRFGGSLLDQGGLAPCSRTRRYIGHGRSPKAYRVLRQHAACRRRGRRRPSPYRMPPAQRSSPRPRGRRRTPRFLILLLLVLSCLASIVACARPAAGAPGDPVQLDVGTRIWYGGIPGGARTRYFWADGAIAYCTNPRVYSPKAGTYAKSELSVSSRHHTIDDVRAALWFSYGSPGFDASMWPAVDYDGSTISDDEYLAYSHIVLADFMHGDASISLALCSSSFKEWFTAHFLGYSLPGSTMAPDPNHLAQQIRQRKGDVPPPDEFSVFLIDTGYNASEYPGTRSQTMISYTYTPRVTITLEKRSADGEMTHGNANYSVEGARYDIYLAATGSLVASITTDARGRADLQLKQGTAYYAVEQRAPKGFTLDQAPVHFTTGNGPETIELSDEPGSATIRLRKRDSATGEGAQTGTSLEGAVYVITDSNGGTHRATTDEKGEASVSGLPLGTVTVREERAPRGYKTSDRVHTYEAAAENLPPSGVIELEATQDLLEDVIAFDLDLVKYADSGGEGSGLQRPAKGVRFDILSGTSGEVVASLMTDEAGRASTTGLWFGRGARPAGVKGSLPFDQGGYIIHEDPATTPPGYRASPDWRIEPDEMADGATLHYIVDNDFVRSRLSIVKQDAETHRTIPLAGFTFEVRDSAGELVVQESWYPAHQMLSAYTTDGSGTVTLPQPLAPGTYTIHEIAAPAPYLRHDEVASVEIGATGATESVTVVTVSDHQAMGQATIAKVCLEPSGSDASHVCDEGCAGSLAGAEFDVVAQHDVMGADGTVWAAHGEVVDRVVTGSDGTATTKRLPLGTGTASYAFVETKPPAGHVADTTAHPFDLSWKDDATDLVVARVEAANDPTETILTKTASGSDERVPDTRFMLWNADDEVAVVPKASKSALAVRTQNAQAAKLREILRTARASAKLPEGWLLELELDDERVALDTGNAALEAGSYHVVITDADRKPYDLGKDATLDIEADMGYTFVHHEGFLGIGSGVALEAKPLEAAVQELSYDAETDTFSSASIDPGSWQLMLDNRPLQEIELAAGEAVYLEETRDGLKPSSHLLAPDARHRVLTTDEEGSIAIRHLAPGTWRIEETRAAAGFVLDPTIRTFVIDGSGRTGRSASYRLDLENDFTKVEFSKRDATTEQALGGAALELVDGSGTTVASWISGDAAHRIDRLPPGSYSLVELSTPHGHEEARAIPVIIEETGELQRVVMYDEPIRVSGEIDKRQEIANPVAPYVEPDATEREGGSNRASAASSPDGVYHYTIDMRSTSSTWVDECTVTDMFEGAVGGCARILSITTPHVTGDHDGLLNVWYQTTSTADRSDAGHGNETTSRSERPSGPGAANATMVDDGNPWLAHEPASGRVGDDGRVVDYLGWSLWKQGVSATRPEVLQVSDLDLGEHEVLCAVRLEFGRVGPEFTSRPDAWSREDLKHVHDDLEPLGAPGGERATSPFIIEAQATDPYISTVDLENRAFIELYRNGGSLFEGEQLEDRDDDLVVQAPVAASPRIDTILTGDDGRKIITSRIETVTDTVSLDGLEPDMRHTLRSSLVDKATGEVLQGLDGGALATETVFTPTESSFTLSVPFEIDAAQLDGRQIVAFQRLSIEDPSTGSMEESGPAELEIASHTSLDDPDQTISIQMPPPLPPTVSAPLLAALGGVAAGAAGLGTWLVKHRRGRCARYPGHVPARHGPERRQRGMRRI